jgi:hypothetical protein
VGRRSWIAVLLALALMALPRLASAGGQGVVFVHGTGDQGSVSAATSYWTSSSLNTMAGGYPYLVVYYPGASYAAYSQGAWGPIVDQTVSWMNSTGITSIVVVTHSNGNNPIRYILQHPTSVSAAGNSASAMTSRIVSLLTIAGDYAGTPLANQVTTAGSFLNIANSVVQFFGGGSYDVPSVVAQRTDNMATYDSNGTFGGSAGASTIDGVPTYTIAGSGVDANLFSSEAWCGGYLMSLGLQLTRCFGWGCGGCADGFIGCNSSTYLGQNIQYDGKLNHNQSRQSCDGAGGTAANIVKQYLVAAAAPPDTAESTAAQACNATVQGWSGDIWFQGCPSGDSYQSNGNYYDCLIAYGASGGYSIPANYGATPYSYSGNYYSQGYSGCQSGWEGNGYCDLCLVAEYGYDGLPGSNAGGADCVNFGPGTTNYCSDIAWNGYVGVWDYGAYTASH